MAAFLALNILDYEDGYFQRRIELQISLSVLEVNARQRVAMSALYVAKFSQSQQ